MKTCNEVKKKLKRCFSDTWLNDERFKSWISKVSFDDSLFHCIICNKNFSCSSLSHITRHAESAHHKSNIGKDPSSDNDNITTKKPSRKKMFRQQWLDIEQFKPWLREVQDDANSFFCTICDKNIVGGLSQIYRHAECKIHKDKLEKCDIQTIKSTKELNTNTKSNEPCLLFDEQKKSAEIRYAALIAEKNIPHETAKMILNFFQEIGKNPNVLKTMSMGRTKCTNIISNVLCPIETNNIVENIQKTPFSVFIDETSDILNEKWMAFYVRYVNPETLQVHSQLVKLIDVDMTDYSTKKLFNAFKQEMLKLKIPFSNIVALSCDNAFVMTGKHLVFKKNLEEMCKNILTLSCPCHSTALAAHVACAKIPQDCEEFVKKVANYITNSPKRTAIFPEFSATFLECFQEKSHKILKLSEMQWLCHHMCIEKLLESWDTIKYFLNETILSEKTKCGEDILCEMQKVDTKAYLLFLKYILHFFNTFNTFFQAVETRIHLLYPKSIDFLIKICTNFLKPELLKDLPNVIFSKTENHKRLTDVNLGPECEEYLCELLKDGYVNVVATVRLNCLQFYITAAEELYKRLPVNNIFLSKLKIFLPQIALLNIEREMSFNDLSLIAKTIGHFDENSLKKEWFILNLDFTIIEKQNLLKLNFDEMWTRILQSKYLNNEIKYPNLRSLLNSIRALPNSNADPERIFTFLTDIKTKKRSKLSSAAVSAIYVLKSALKTRGETALSMKISAKHLSLMSSDKLYSNSPKRQKSSNVTDNNIAGPSSSIDID